MQYPDYRSRGSGHIKDGATSLGWLTATPTDPWNSDNSTRDTIAKMIVIARQSASSPEVQALANHALQRGENIYSQRDTVRYLFHWIKGHVSFKEDESIASTQLGISDEVLNDPVTTIDLLITPPALLQMREPTGDCDDFSMLMASCLVTLHIQCWFVTIAADQNQPNRFSHVYVLARYRDGSSQALDCSHGNKPGWEYAGNVYRKHLWGVNT